jgi:hypothetical protein
MNSIGGLSIKDARRIINAFETLELRAVDRRKADE